MITLSPLVSLENVVSIAFLLSSDALAVIELLYNAVHGDQKHNVDHGIE